MTGGNFKTILSIFIKGKVTVKYWMAPEKFHRKQNNCYGALYSINLLTEKSETSKNYVINIQ